MNNCSYDDIIIAHQIECDKMGLLVFFMYNARRHIVSAEG